MNEKTIVNNLIRLSQPNQFNELEFDGIMNLTNTNKLLNAIITFFNVKENNKLILTNIDFYIKILEKTTERFLQSQNSEIKVKFLEIFNNYAIHDYYLNTSNINDYSIFDLLLKYKNGLLKNSNTKSLYLNVIHIITENHNFVEKYPQLIKDILISSFKSIDNSILEFNIKYKYLDIIQAIMKNSNFTEQNPQLIKDILISSFKSIDNKTINQNTKNKYLDIIQTIATNNNFIRQYPQEAKYILVQLFKSINNLETDNNIANEYFNVIKKILKNSSFINQNSEAVKDILDQSFKTFNSLEIEENIKEYSLCIIQEIVKNHNFTVHYPQVVKDLLDRSFESIDDQEINQYDKNKYLQIIQAIIENNSFTEQYPQLIRDILISSFKSVNNPKINQYSKYKYLDLIKIIVENNNFTEQYQGTIVDILIQSCESIENPIIDQKIKTKYSNIINVIIENKKYSSIIDNLKEKINSDFIRQQTMNVVFNVENLLNDIKQKVQEKISNGNTGDIIETIKDSIKEYLNPTQLIEEIEKKIPNIKGENANIIKLFLSNIIEEVKKEEFYLRDYMDTLEMQANLTLKEYMNNEYKDINNVIDKINIELPEGNIDNDMIKMIFNSIINSKGFKTYIEEITPFFINEKIFMNAIETKIISIRIPYEVNDLPNTNIEDRDAIRSISYILRNLAKRNFVNDNDEMNYQANLIKAKMLELVVQTNDIKVIESYRDILKFYQNYNMDVATSGEEIQIVMEAIKRSPGNNNKLAGEIGLICNIINKRKESLCFENKKYIDNILDSLQDVSNNMDKGGNLDSYMENLNNIVELDYFLNETNVLNELKKLSLKIIEQTESIKVINNYNEMLSRLKRKNCVSFVINRDEMQMIMDKIQRISMDNDCKFFQRANDLAKYININYDYINNKRLLVANFTADKGLTFKEKKAPDMF